MATKRAKTRLKVAILDEIGEDDEEMMATDFFLCEVTWKKFI